MDASETTETTTTETTISALELVFMITGQPDSSTSGLN